jgi:hypothetical protein
MHDIRVAAFRAVGKVRLTSGTDLGDNSSRDPAQNVRSPVTFPPAAVRPLAYSLWGSLPAVSRNAADCQHTVVRGSAVQQTKVRSASCATDFCFEPTFPLEMPGDKKSAHGHLLMALHLRLRRIRNRPSSLRPLSRRGNFHWRDVPLGRFDRLVHRQGQRRWIAVGVDDCLAGLSHLRR